MATAASIDLVYYRGDSAPIAFIVTVTATGAAKDISSYQFVLTVDPDADPPDDTTKLMQLTGVVTDGPNGKFQFAPTTTESDFEPDTYFYDVQMIDTSTAKTTVIKGKFTLKQDVTKT